MDTPAVDGGWRHSARFAMRLGFVLFLSLLLVSAFETFWIQREMSRETAEIHRRHVVQVDTMFIMRRALWLGASTARDFLLNPHADRLATFERDRQQYKSDCEKSMDSLSQEGLKAEVDRLRPKIDEFWAAISAIPEASAGADAAGRYALIQSEVIPRRNAAGEMVRQLTELSHAARANSEKALSDSLGQASRRQATALVLSIVCGLVVAFLSLRHTDQLERDAARHLHEVSLARDTLEKLSQRLMEVQEEERRNLARELHDEIGQALATTRLQIARAHTLLAKDVPAARDRLADAKALVDGTINTVRNISLLLRPSLLDDLGLGPAIQWQVDQFARRTGIKVDYEESGLPDNISDEVRTCVYRVVQEALHNCEKYAGASKAQVELRQEHDWITVRIADDGRGFPLHDGLAAAPDRGLGILGMRERAHRLGGTLDIDSAPGRGALIRLRLPHARPVAGVGEESEGVLVRGNSRPDR